VIEWPSAMSERDFLHLLDEFGLTRITHSLLAKVQPCLYAICGPTPDVQVPVGSSKFGGQPDLPANADWPISVNAPLWFVAQLHLSESASLHLGSRLQSGMLWFFYDDAGGPAGPHSQVHYVSVISEQQLVRRTIPLDPRYTKHDFSQGHFMPHAVELRQGVSIPDDLEVPYLDPIQLTRDESSAYRDFRSEFRDRQCEGGQPVHQLLGYPENDGARLLWQAFSAHGSRQGLAVPANPRQLMSNTKKETRLALIDQLRKWRLLAQFEGVNDRYYFMIHDEDLSTLDFNRPFVIYECS
jgi:hypothetical protein